MAPTQPNNLTGFDIRKYRAAAGQIPKNDPWARAEAWRYTGPFTRRNRFKGLFPGFGTAAVAFTIYCGYEYLFLSDHHGQPGQGHEQQKH